MFRIKFSIVCMFCALVLPGCSDSTDEASDPENSCENSGLQIESIEIEENMATATATGGTPPYEYEWSDGTQGNVYIGWSGTYVVTVTDSKGCTATREALLEGVYNFAGTWEMVVFQEDVPVGEYVEHYSTDCPDIVVNKTSMSGSYEFQLGEYEALFEYSITDSTINTNIEYNADCEIVSDLPDTETENTETGEGVVYFDGSNFVLNYFNGGEETVIILGQDRIKIADEEYERL